MQFKDQLTRVHESRCEQTSSHWENDDISAAHVLLKIEAFRMEAELRIDKLAKIPERTRQKWILDYKSRKVTNPEALNAKLKKKNEQVLLEEDEQVQLQEEEGGGNVYISLLSTRTGRLAIIAQR